MALRFLEVFIVRFRTLPGRRPSLSSSLKWQIATDTVCRVVQQKFIPQVYDDYVIRGNTAVLRCHLPSFVREYVTLDSWLIDDDIVLKSTDIEDDDRFNSCQAIYSQFGLAIHQNDHQARRRFVEWDQTEIAVVPDFHKLILFSDEAHFWFNGYVNKQNCHIWSEANPQVYVETPLHPETLTVWCALWAG
ncbi:down syndrome cell adhesion molecule [Trichonephila clavipes]|nr:down syndrome cell adhesion molecule [Trichonephila clavipes]